MKYLIILIIFVLYSCTVNNDKSSRALNDLIEDSQSFMKEVKKTKKDKNNVKKEKKSIFKKKISNVKKDVQHNKKIVKKNKILDKKKKKKNKVDENILIKSVKLYKNIDIYDVKNINEYEEFLDTYSENSDYPNINN